jgi:hypothetical protein
VHVPNFFDRIVAEPILSKKTLKCLLGFPNNRRQLLLEGAKYIEGPHCCLCPAHMNERFVEILQRFDIFGPTASVDIGSLDVPVRFDA